MRHKGEMVVATEVAVIPEVDIMAEVCGGGLVQ